MPTRRDFLKTVCGVAALALGPVLLADEATAADGIDARPMGRSSSRSPRCPVSPRSAGP